MWEIHVVWSNLKFRRDKEALNFIPPVGDRLAQWR